MATISIPLALKESVDSYLKEVGLSWTDYLRNEIGYGPSPSVAKALEEAAASGMSELTYSSAKELFDDVLGEGWDVTT